MNRAGLIARRWIFAAPFVLAGCAVGNGQYFQVLDKAGAVISESDAPSKGFQNCPNQAYEVMRNNKALDGRVKCAAEPTREPLPYSFSALTTKTLTADEVLPTSAFVIRARTSAVCTAMLKSVKTEAKMQILEEHCAAAAN